MQARCWKHLSSLVHTCAFMMRSMLADQPCLEVTTTTGVFARRLETLTPITSLPSCSFHHFVRSLYSSCDGVQMHGHMKQCPG